MTLTTKPKAQLVREWMQQRQVERAPLPTPAEIRTQLGWELLKPSAECAR